MIYPYIKHVLLITLTFLLVSCGFFDRDNTPIPARLVEFEPAYKPRFLWSARTGASVGKEYAKVNPAISDSAIYTTSNTGIVTSTSKIDGHRIWRTYTR